MAAEGASSVTKHNIQQFTFYELFGVAAAAGSVSEKDVRRSYRRFSLLFHPDKDDSAEARDAFLYVNKALETLLTPELRRDYDDSLKAPSPSTSTGSSSQRAWEATMRAAEEARRAEEVLTAKDAQRKAEQEALRRTAQAQEDSIRQFVRDLTQHHDAPFREMEKEIIRDWNVDRALLKQKEVEVKKLLKELWEHSAREEPPLKRPYGAVEP